MPSIRAFPAPLRLLPTAIVLVAACAFAALLWTPTAMAQTVRGSGVAATEARSVGDFVAVAAAGSIDLTIRQGAAVAVAVTADDNVLPLVETVVEDGRDGRVLSVRLKRGAEVRSTRTPIRVAVTVVELKALSLSGSGDATVEGLKTPSLALRLTGSSDARIGNLQTDAFTVSIAGSGDVRADGGAGKVELSIAGSGDADFSRLASDDVKVSIAGSGDAKVVAHKALAVRIAGSGDVSYTGQATDVTSRIAGSGSVRRR